MAWYWIFVGGFFLGVGVMVFDLLWRQQRRRERLWRELPERLAREREEQPPAA